MSGGIFFSIWIQLQKCNYYWQSPIVASVPWRKVSSLQIPSPIVASIPWNMYHHYNWQSPIVASVAWRKVASLYAHIERVGVSRMRDFYYIKPIIYNLYITSNTCQLPVVSSASRLLLLEQMTSILPGKQRLFAAMYSGQLSHGEQSGQHSKICFY